jgi:hypothetical protein
MKTMKRFLVVGLLAGTAALAPMQDADAWWGSGWGGGPWYGGGPWGWGGYPYSGGWGGYPYYGGWGGYPGYGWGGYPYGGWGGWGGYPGYGWGYPAAAPAATTPSTTKAQ